MNVLSLFDGISCGRVALERAGIKVDKYYASEIDKVAISISAKNYPDIIHLGDVTNWESWGVDWREIDLLIGGSPCTGFSSGGKGLNFNDPQSKLFFYYLSILRRIQSFNPKVKFLLENVKMKEEWSRVISDHMEVPYTEINSRYFSAQNRVRYYWNNWKIPSFKDKGILLRDIVEDDYIHSAAKRTRPLVDEGYRKSLCLEVNGIDKAMCLVTVNLNNLLTPLPRGRYKDVSLHNYPYRVMSVREMEHLQTVPENYVGDISPNKAAKVLGNGWTVDVISHIFSGLE
jgi:DNA (cytosine-5)-methyltransferase 3A